MKKLWPWSKLEELEHRVFDIERHFVTRYDPKSGAPAETLADVPVDERKDRIKPRLAGLTWQQKKAILESTDGFRR